MAALKRRSFTQLQLMHGDAKASPFTLFVVS